MFMKLKSDEVTIKGRCAYGRKHRYWLSKENNLPPTVSTEGLMLSCMIDAMESWEVETANIPGAFLHTDYDEIGAMVTLLEDTDPECYRYFIYTYKCGRKCMYAEDKKDIYGTLDS